DPQRGPHGSGVHAGRSRSPRLPPRQPPGRARQGRVRLFVALNLPETVRNSLCSCVRPLQSMGFALRWMTPEQVHLTLKFLGDVEPEREGELVAALGRACTGARPVTLSLGGFGVFPRYERPRVVWGGVAPEPALELPQHGME